MRVTRALLNMVAHVDGETRAVRSSQQSAWTGKVHIGYLGDRPVEVTKSTFVGVGIGLVRDAELSRGTVNAIPPGASVDKR